MECPACHTANPDSNRFCEACGGALRYKCAACGFDCPPLARFCGGCGVALGREGSADPVAPAHHGGILASELSTGWGELKQATVLFADIVSSTEQIAQLDPEQAMDRLKPAVMLMCEAVERFGGTVMRTLGDGVMALFGVPKALEGHARLACESALHMQAAFTGNPQGFSIRVGLHSGLVASDPQAHDSGKGGGAHGLTIHLASRVIGLAPPGGVTMTQECHSQVRDLVDVESIGQPPLKGIPEPVEIFRLKGLKAAFASQHFHQAKLTPFRGRDEEMALLAQGQRLTEAGNAQVIGVSGGPGTGKSRLCFEFAKWCRARGKAVFEVRAQLYGSATPLQPVLELMRTFLFAIDNADTPATARDKIAARLAQLGAAQPGDEGLLCDFLGVLDAQAAPPAAAPAKARRARLLAVVAALVRQAADTASVILIEDMHWLDEASEEFVAALVDAAASTRIMVVLNYRPSYSSPWAGLDKFREIELRELNAADTDAIVRELMSYRREFRDIAQLITRRSGGNPFFAEELVRAIAERGVLSGDPHHGGNGLESVERALPATVQAVIGARIDRLGEVEKSILQMCAIIGKEVPQAILESVAGSLRGHLEGAMDALCRAEMIQSQPAAGGRRFSFRHPLIQEVAYESQMKARRAAIHASVASAMEHLYAGQPGEFAALISHHHECAGQHLRAAEHSARAAQWLGLTDSAQAIKHWHKVRTLLAGQDQGEAAERMRALACSQISLLGWREGLSLEQVQPYIDEAMELAVRVDSRLTQLLLTIEGRMLQASGGPADWYVQRVREALRLADAEADRGRLATLNAALCHACGWAGLLNDALAASEVALADVALIDRADQDFMGFSVEQWVLGMRARLLMRCGRFEEAQACWERMLEVQGAAADPAVQVIRHLGFVELAWCNDDAALAQQHSAQLSDMAQRHALPYLKPIALTCRGMALTIAADHASATSAFDEALALVRRENLGVEYETEILAGHAECQRRAGNLGRARELAEEALDIARQRTMRLAECRVMTTLGAIMLDDRGVGDDVAPVMLAAASKLVGETGAVIYGRHLQAAMGRMQSLAA